MELKLFGKSLFEFKKGASYLLPEAVATLPKSKYLPDFYVNFNNNGGGIIENWVVMEGSNGMIAVPKGKKGDKKKPKPAPVKIEITPKGVYEAKFLDDTSFKLKTDPKYVDGQIEDFKDKLALLKKEEYDMRNGVAEVQSVLIRMENRKKYPAHKDFFEQYPYTTTAKISELVKVHDHLKLGQIAQFVADLPKEAVDVMKHYNKETQKLCEKDAVFYIVANKKDFQKSDKRRDPILLAQSPFGHAWQILGAWDEEMLLIDEL